MGGKGKEKKQKKMREKLECKRSAILQELRGILQSKVVIDRPQSNDGADPTGLIWVLHSTLKSAKKPEDTKDFAQDCWSTGLEAFAKGSNLEGAAIMNYLADLWIWDETVGTLTDMRDKGLAAIDLARLSVLKNAVECLLEGHKDVIHPSEYGVMIPDLSREGDPVKSEMWLETTWRAVTSHADEADEGVIRQLGKTKGASSAAAQALNAIKSRCIVQNAIKDGYLDPGNGLPREQLVARMEYLVALHVVGDDYPMKVWPVKWRESAAHFIRSKGWMEPSGEMSSGVENFVLTEAGSKAVHMLSLAPKPF
jgi:hypothetical protein